MAFLQVCSGVAVFVGQGNKRKSIERADFGVTGMAL